MDSYTKHIKRVLVITTQDLKEKSQHQKKQQDFAVLAKEIHIELLRYPRESYSK